MPRPARVPVRPTASLIFLLNNVTVQQLCLDRTIDPDSRAVKRQVYTVRLYLTPELSARLLSASSAAVYHLMLSAYRQ